MPPLLKRCRLFIIPLLAHPQSTLLAMAPSSNSSKSGLSAKEGSSVDSQSSILSITVSETKDPVDFVKKRGYEVLGTIASGTFSKVYRARYLAKNTVDNSEPTYIPMAIKVMNLNNPDQRIWMEKCLKNEMYISKYVKHPNVVLSCDVFKTKSYGYIIMRLAENGSIKADLWKRLKRPYVDKEAKEYFKGLASGLNYIHGQNIVHRDIKLENFLLSAENVPMLTDWGFAARAKVPSNVVLTEQLRRTICGTAGYMAAELFPTTMMAALGTGGSNSKTKLQDWHYDAKAVDVFAMGVSLFEMFNLRKPFGETITKSVVKKIAAHDVHYHNHKVENACKNLIRDMLHIEPKKRPKAEELLKHRWVEHGSMINAIMDKLHIG